MSLMRKQASTQLLVQSACRPAAPSCGGDVAGLLCSPEEGEASGDPALEPPALCCAGRTHGTGAGGHSAAHGACSSPCPQGQQPSQGWLGCCSQTALGTAVPSPECPMGSVPQIVPAVRLACVEPCARQESADSHHVCAGEGLLYPGCPFCVGCGGAWGWWGAAPVSLLRLMPFISELLARVRAELEMSGTAAG